MVKNATYKVIVLFLFFISSEIFSSFGKYEVVGGNVGSSSCAEYISERDNRSVSLIYHFWLSGFVTAFNYSLVIKSNVDGMPKVDKNVIPASSMDEVVEWVDNYCKANPDQRFADAVSMMTNYYLEKKIKDYPQKIVPEPGDLSTSKSRKCQ